MKTLNILFLIKIQRIHKWSIRLCILENVPSSPEMFVISIPMYFCIVFLLLTWTFFHYWPFQIWLKDRSQHRQVSLCTVLPPLDPLGFLTSSSCCGTGHLTEETLKKRGTTLSWSASEALSSKTCPVERAMPRMTRSVKESKYWTV